MGSSQSRRRGLQHERARQGHALLLAARELAGPMVEPLAQPHRAPAARARARSWPCPSRGATSVGTSTFSSTVHCGSRQWSWNTKPTSPVAEGGQLRLGEREGILADERDRAAVGRLQRAQDVRSVLLPLPEGPMTQSDSPGGEREDTPSRMERGPRGVGVVLAEARRRSSSGGHPAGRCATAR